MYILNLNIPIEPDDPSPYLFHLPRDMAAVRTLSACFAMQIAYESSQRGLEGVPLTDEVEVAAKANCASCLQDIRHGKQGCNAPALFRRLYVETFIPVYIWAYYAFTHDIYTVSSDLSDQEREDIFTRWVVELFTPHN